MKCKPCLVFLVALAGVTMTLPDLAHGGRGYYHGGHRGHHGGHWGVYLGIPWAWPGWYYPYYYPPYYPYSAPVVVESQPRTYIERGDLVEDAGEPYYWYYCDKPRGYHPYVDKCPGGWKKVVPAPPAD